MSRTVGPTVEKLARVIGSISDPAARASRLGEVKQLAQRLCRPLPSDFEALVDAVASTATRH